MAKGRQITKKTSESEQKKKINKKIQNSQRKANK